jgi:diguanylate cyclase (GGDEF)-like protein
MLNKLNIAGRLASPPARATDEIGGKIGAVERATQNAAAAISSIIALGINAINKISGAISGAVEQRSIATGEIAHNVQQVAAGTQNAETSYAAGQGLESSLSLARETTGFKEKVRRFLQGVRAAYVGVFTDVSNLKQSEIRLDFLAHHDPLTGLPNLLLLHSRIERAVAKAARNNSSGAVLFLDIDRFKTVTNSLGHTVGDQLLILVAKRLNSILRPSDILGRQGGDEFIVLIEDAGNAQDVAAIAQRLIDVIAQPFALPCEREVFIGLSIGVSLFPQDADTCDALTQHADSALYLAKKCAGAAVRFYSPTLTKAADARLKLEAGLRRALERGEFELQYQPLIDLAEGKMTGVEALVRWRSPLGLIMPMEFIPLAEETGLIIPLGDWVLREACNRMKAWRDAGRDIAFIAVNLSPHQFAQTDLCERVSAILTETGLGPEFLEIEITESALMQQGCGAEAKLDEFKALGLRIAIDDFGTGHSSLAYLKRFPIDKLKIDRSFISDFPSDPAGMEITSAVIRLAHSLKVKALVEGVETEAQADFLALCGCDMAQGYYFDRPLWESDLMECLDRIRNAGLRRHG